MKRKTKRYRYFLGEYLHRARRRREDDAMWDLAQWRERGTDSPWTAREYESHPYFTEVSEAEAKRRFPAAFGKSKGPQP